MKYHIIFSASYYKINAEDQRIDETELFFNLKVNHNLTEIGNHDHDDRAQLDHQIEETKDSGEILDKIISTKVRFYENDELNGASYDKTSLRSNANLNIENKDENCFLWSILAPLHPCENIHPSRVKTY